MLVQSLAAQGRFEDAQDALANIGTSAQAKELRGRLELVVAMRAGDARRALDVLVAMQPSGHEFLVEHIRVLAALDKVSALEDRLAELDDEDADEWRQAWTAAIRGEYADTLASAQRVLNSGDPAEARRLGIVAAQAGDAEVALEYFSAHFIAWLEGVGPLRGPVALETAPWFAHSLRAVGRDSDAQPCTR